jgi:YesN/AraC family two-component response regulator
MEYIQREITPIRDEDLFVVLNHPNAKFDYAIHFHSDYEINMVLNTKGKRIVGDNVTEYDGIDLVMIGPNIPHRWLSDNEEDSAHVVTIQFHKEILEYPIINKKVFHQLRQLFFDSSYGIEFSHDTKMQMKDIILNLPYKQGVASALGFFKILHYLSISKNQRMLLESNSNLDFAIRESKSRRINKVITYIQEHFQEEITLSYIAGSLGMSESAFSHFFKKRTNRSFVDYLNDIRVGHASKLLYETTHTIAEVCYTSGFNNVSNFNRIFKKKKGQTPSTYRKNIQKIMIRF